MGILMLLLDGVTGCWPPAVVVGVLLVVGVENERTGDTSVATNRTVIATTAIRPRLLFVVIIVNKSTLCIVLLFVLHQQKRLFLARLLDKDDVQG